MRFDRAAEIALGHDIVARVEVAFAEAEIVIGFASEQPRLVPVVSAGCLFGSGGCGFGSGRSAIRRR
jgi:hypothetical protein